jgi:hypothetical protein
MTGNPRELAALLLGYIDGDVVARKVLLDWLEEHEDPRLAAVREEAIDWATVAVQLSGQPERVDLPRYTWQSERRYFTAHTNHLRFQIDCARVGADVPEAVRRAVREARRAWLTELFPEINWEEHTT